MVLLGAQIKYNERRDVFRTLILLVIPGLLLLHTSNNSVACNNNNFKTDVCVNHWFVAVATANDEVTTGPESVITTDPESTENECEIAPDGTCVTNVDDDGVDNSDVVVVSDDDLAHHGMKIESVDDDGMSLINTGFGVTQRLEVDHRHILIEIQKYMNDTVFSASADDALSTVASECQLRHELCAFWAVIDECEANSAFMKVQCSPACFACDYLLFETRCPFPENVTDILVAGGLNDMFERIVTDPYYREQYTIEVLSRPINVNGMSNEIGGGPWVVILDNFLTDEECDTMIRLGRESGYERSLEVGQKRFDGTYENVQIPGRTSYNAWCIGSCVDHPTMKIISTKIENVTGIPDANHEFFQILKYEETQFYEQHNDYKEFFNARAYGARILTVFLYLNDVEQDGTTQTVQPKRGRALIWPSVLDENPTVIDPRTDHQALPLLGGEKYAANAWIHLRDFKTPFHENCV